MHKHVELVVAFDSEVNFVGSKFNNVLRKPFIDFFVAANPHENFKLAVETATFQAGMQAGHRLEMNTLRNANMISGCGNKPSSKSFEYVHSIFRELQTIANENSFASESDEKQAIFRRMTHLERHLVEPNDAKRIEDREVHAYSHVI